MQGYNAYAHDWISSNRLWEFLKCYETCILFIQFSVFGGFEKPLSRYVLRGCSTFLFSHIHLYFNMECQPRGNIIKPRNSGVENRSSNKTTLSLFKTSLKTKKLNIFFILSINNNQNKINTQWQTNKTGMNGFNKL